MTNVERDYDFVLLSFDSAVTLTGASFSWLYSGSDSQVSVAALSNTSKLTSGVNTWSDIVANALTSASFDIENCESINRPDFREERQILHALSLGVRDYFIKTGHKKAVLGVSGGIDSSLTTVIANDALGSENVLGISMPSIYSSDHSIEDAKALAENIGIDFQIIPIKKINEQMLEDLSPVLVGSPEGLAEENLQARIRGNILMAAANKQGALLLNTGNKTETALGYCTMYGDMAGALAVISDLNKSQVYAVSRWINENAEREVIPENSIIKPPSAELKLNQVDPFDYDMVSPLVDIFNNRARTCS